MSFSQSGNRTFARTVAMVALATAAFGCASGGGRHSIAPSSGSDQLRVARLHYERHEYMDAIELLKGYIQFQSGASDLDEAHFLLGMTYTGQREWPLATGEFLIVTSDFQDSKRLPDAHYWLGYAYWKQSHSAPYDQDPTRRAIAQFERFMRLYPDHPKVPEVQALRLEGRTRLAEKSLRNARLYMKQKRFGPARYYFDQVRNDYSDTKWVDAAIVGSAEAAIAIGDYITARSLLEEHVPAMADPQAKRRGEQLMKKIGAVEPPAQAAPADTTRTSSGMAG